MMDLSKEYPGGWVSHVNSLMAPDYLRDPFYQRPPAADPLRDREQRDYMAMLELAKGRPYL